MRVSTGLIAALLAASWESVVVGGSAGDWQEKGSEGATTSQLGSEKKGPPPLARGGPGGRGASGAVT